MTETSRLEIDLFALRHNLGVVRRALDQAAGLTAREPAERAARPKICAVLKADGYGLGAARLARALMGHTPERTANHSSTSSPLAPAPPTPPASRVRHAGSALVRETGSAQRLPDPAGGAGVDMIAVYTPEQARELTEPGLAAPVLILMPLTGLDRRDHLYRGLSRGLIHLSVHSAESLAAIEAIAGTYGLALPVHLWIDTGMTRDGCDPAQAGDLLRRIADNKRLRLAGVATHFASADTDAAATRVQSERFIKALAPHAELIPDTCLFHQANSFGLFRAGALHSDMVRVGLSLLGYGSEEFPGFADDDGPAGVEFAQAARSLKPTVRWLSRVVHVREIEPGTRVGYGGTWTAPSPEANAQLRGMRIGPGEGRARIAVVPVGYADGYPLALSNIARVGIRLPEDVGTGIVAYAPVVGRVSMDQLTIDVSALPVRGAIVGQEVELISNRPDAPNHLPTLARLAGTITHELLCRLAQVPGRSYVSREVVQDVGGRVVLPPIHPTVRAASAG